MFEPCLIHSIVLTLVEQLLDAHVDVIDPLSLLVQRCGVHRKGLDGRSNEPAVLDLLVCGGGS